MNHKKSQIMSNDLALQIEKMIVEYKYLELRSVIQN